MKEIATNSPCLGKAYAHSPIMGEVRALRMRGPVYTNCYLPIKLKKRKNKKKIKKETEKKRGNNEFLLDSDL